MNPKTSISKIAEYYELLPQEQKDSITEEHIIELLEAEGIISVHASGGFFSWLKGHVMTKEEFINLFNKEAINP